MKSDIVDAVVKSPRRILLIAAKSGQNNVFFSDGDAAACWDSGYLRRARRFTDFRAG